MKTMKKKAVAKKTAAKKSVKMNSSKNSRAVVAKKPVKKTAKSPVERKPIAAKKKASASKFPLSKSVASVKPNGQKQSDMHKVTSAKSLANQKVNRAKKTKEQSEFPGYPLYAPADDIMNRAQRTEADLDYPKGSPKVAPFQPSIDTEADEQEITKKKKTKSKGPNDVTKEDLKTLGDDNLEMDGGDDEELRDRTTPVDFAGTDLDVPVDDDDKSDDEAGSEDEENKTYSLGGDDHDDLEEDKA